MKNLGEIIVKPIITEKSLKEASLGRYSFLVAKTARKGEIKHAVEGLFNVKARGVYTNIVKGTRVRSTRDGRRRIAFSYKKARVQLGKGQKIDVFPEKEG